MVVFKDISSRIAIESYFSRIRMFIEIVNSTNNITYDNAISLLIDTGELETGITDLHCTDYDDIISDINSFHQLTLLAGHIFCNINKNSKISDSIIQNFITCFSCCEQLSHSITIPFHTSEGFCYYGLYPEIYIESTEKFLKDKQPQNILCLGLRSIGTALSSVVTATLDLSGCNVISLTVRPRGHPFDRKLILSKQFEQVLTSRTDFWYVIVDEGPGLSGSSIGGTLEKLFALGINSEKTVIFPSWNPDSSYFISKSASSLWSKSDKYIGNFETQWIDNARFESVVGKRILENISAGFWRNVLYTNDHQYPAVHPHHERRKYLLSDVESYTDVNTMYIAKFIGLGKYGIDLNNRATIISDAGFSPKIYHYNSGFTIAEFCNGNPCTPNDISPDLLKFASEYFSFLKLHFPSTTIPPFEKMLNMIYTNILEGLGDQWISYFELLEQFPQSLYYEDTVAIDGRTMPHEWIATERGLLKTDHIEHHADQFFPQCQNIAWDIAGFSIEFNLNNKLKNALIANYVERTKDNNLFYRISFYYVAYAAFRLGYVSTARLSNIGDFDKLKFQYLSNHYKYHLSQSLKDYKIF